MRNLLTFLLGIALTAVVHAAPPSSASIDELLTVTKAESIVRAITANSDVMIRQGIKESLKGVLQQYLDAFAAFVEKQNR